MSSNASFTPLSRLASTAAPSLLAKHPSGRRALVARGVVGIAALSLLAACGTGSAAGGNLEPGAGAETTAATATSGSPLTLDNCGFDVTVDSPPQRVITIKSTAMEMLLSLGLGDRIVGSAFLDGPVPDDLADAAADVPNLSDQVPGQEAVLGQTPDLVYAGWESNFSSDGAGDRQTLADRGVLTYVSPAACKAEGYMPDPLTFDKVFEEITEVGDIFGVPDAAASLVEKQKAELAAVTPDDRGLTALWYSSGEDVPYVGAGIGAPQMIMDAVGLTNVAASVHDTWTSYGWEQVVATDPDVIILVDATWNTAQSKIDMLESNAVTSKLTAVKEKRFLVVPFPASEAGVRNVSAVTDLTEQLGALQITG